jgi:hypothetical protein
VLAGSRALGIAMARWREFERARPALAERGREILYNFGVPLGYLATVRRDAALIVRRIRRYARHEEFSIMVRHRWGAVITPVSLLVAALLCLNALGWPFEPVAAPYLLALVWGLSWAAAVFADLIFVRPGPS